MCADKKTEEPSLCVREVLVKQVLQTLEELQASSPNMADGGHADEADCVLYTSTFSEGDKLLLEIQWHLPFCQSLDEFSVRAGTLCGSSKKNNRKLNFEKQNINILVMPKMNMLMSC